MSDIIEELAVFSNNPYGFVMFSFPWGEEGTELEKFDGPEKWQTTVLQMIGEGLLTLDEAIRIAVASGHGIGKSALVAWVILWALSTFEDTKGVVTANTETQLKTKTWAELSKWYRLFIGRELFEFTATAIFSVDKLHEKTWRVDMVPWSERNTEAFAGLHNKGKRILLIKDEASAIPDVIWEVSEGALTDSNTQIIDLSFGNPTRNKGAFRQCFAGGEFAHRWKTFQVDSRTVRITNLKKIQQWVDDYGEDSDFVRVRVRGTFPRVDAESFIPYDLAYEASHRTAVPEASGIVLGVDVGRFGDDPSVIVARKGNDAKFFEPVVLFKADTMAVASRAAQIFSTLGASIAFVDEGGVGGGVVDRMRQLQVPVIGVNFAASPDNPDVNDGAKYANKRAELYGRMRLWLHKGSIPDKVHGLDMGFVDELTSPMYGLNDREAIQLERKRDMRKRGIKSPNLADALALTFAYTVVPKALELPAVLHQTPDFNPFDRERMVA